MQIVSVENLKPGMQLARTLYGDEGQVLLYAGIILTWTYINRIRDLKFIALYIGEPGDPPDEEIMEPVRAETRAKAITIAKNTMYEVVRSGDANLDQLQSVVSEMIDQIFYNPHTIYNIIDIRTHDDYTFAHSVNVGILSILTGLALNYNRRKLEILGIGAVLHDVGKIFIPSAILNKPGQLEPNEYETIKEHTIRGYQLLKEENICYVSSHIAYEHHEREDGSGYPRSLTGSKTHSNAKIVAVADAFDAMTSNRVYKNALPTHLALKELQELAGIKFSKPVVDCFKKVIAPYPLGSVLRLVNGEIVTVIKATKTECLVKATSNVGSEKIFDLYHFPDLTVVEVIKE